MSLPDDHEPITEEWWREWFGAAAVDGWGCLTQSVCVDIGFILRFNRLDGLVTLRVDDAVLCLSQVRTRGDVRELCRLLGEKSTAGRPQHGPMTPPQ